MKTRRLPGRNRDRGFVLLTVIIFIGVTSVLLAGIGAFAVSHNTNANKDADWAASLNLAETGANTLLSRISRNAVNVDQAATTYSLASGTYTTWVTQRNSDGTETTPWTSPNDLYVYCRGTTNGVSRTVKVAVKANIVNHTYAVYGINRLEVQGSVDITGNIGSNGAVIVAGGGTDIDGIIGLNGPNAVMSGAGGNGINVNPFPVAWLTVDETAMELFPQGGMSWLATHNDNTRAGLNANGALASITGSITLTGPGNYFVKSINLTGNNKIRFDNRSGSVNLWVGPSGSSGSVAFHGTTDAVPTSSGHSANMYVGTTGMVTMQGNTQFRGNIFAYNKMPDGTQYGRLTNGGNPNVAGSIMAWDVYLHGNPQVDFITTNLGTGVIGYYGYDNSWAEIKQVNGSWVPGGR